MADNILDPKRKRDDGDDNSFVQTEKSRKTEEQGQTSQEKIKQGNTTGLSTEKPDIDTTSVILASMLEAFQNKEIIDMMSKNIVAPIVAHFEEKIQNLETVLSEKNIKIKKLENNVNKLQEKLLSVEDKLEKFNKDKNLTIDGIKETTNENVRQVAIGFIRNKLEIDLKEYEICEVYRVGRFRNSSSRRIIIKFWNSEIKNAIFKKRLSLRTNADPFMKNIFINEDLTRKNQEILFESRKLKKAKKIANTWTRDGSVFIKVDDQDTPVEIKEKGALNKYMAALNITDEELGKLGGTSPRTSSQNDIDKMAQSVLNFTFPSPKPNEARLSPVSNETISSYRDQSPPNDPEAKGQRPNLANDNRINSQGRQCQGREGSSSAV